MDLPAAELMLDVDLENTMWAEHTSSWYCDLGAMNYNIYVEAILNWARIHGIKVILKEVYHPSYPRGWLDGRQMFEGRVTALHSKMSNYPETMAEYLPLSPCLRWVTSVEEYKKNGLLTKFANGIGTIDFRSLRNGNNKVIGIDEVVASFQVVASVFPVIEVVFGESGTDIGLESLVKAIQKFQRSPKHSRSEINFCFKMEASTALKLAITQAEKFRRLLSIGNSVIVRLYNWKGLETQILSELVPSFKNKIKLGLDIDSVLIRASSSSEGSLLSQVSYVFHTSPPFPAHTHRIREMGKYLDTIFRHTTFLENQLQESIKSKIQVVHQVEMAESRLEGPNGTVPISWTATYLQFLRDTARLAGKYNKTLVYRAFDDQTEGLAGWWKIENSSDLSKTFSYIDKESEFLGLPRTKPATPKDLTSNTWLILGLTLFSVIIFVVAIGLGIRLRSQSRKFFLSEEEVKEFLQGNKGISLRDLSGEQLYAGMKFSERFEIDKFSLVIDETNILGSGNFGTVFQGTVDNRNVAIKRPKKGCDKGTFKSMLNEVKVMCNMGQHENVLEFIGCCTKEIRQGMIYITTELCENGSLLFYLQTKRKESGPDSGTFVALDCYPELVRFASEIAAGMKHISSKKIIHGDLSTRNVLLNEHNICKIGDFGLSRKLYEYEKYVKQSQEPLPWRWMAYESLRFMEFTSSSDMWSFGVTLWEIFSLGALPYSGRGWTVEFPLELLDGLRLEKPVYATDEIYTQIQTCWHIEPKLRPTFEDMTTTLVSMSVGADYAIV